MSMQEAWKEETKKSGRFNLVGEYQKAIAKEFFEIGWLACHREMREKLQENSKAYSWMRKKIED